MTLRIARPQVKDTGMYQCADLEPVHLKILAQPKQPPNCCVEPFVPKTYVISGHSFLDE